MKHLCVFCSANDLGSPYREVGKQFGTLLVDHGYRLVWGGSNTGLMKVLADTVQEKNGYLIGISMELLAYQIRPNINEAIIAKDLGDRKQTMLVRADAFVVLIGGLGTLDEISEIMELKKLKVHTKPIVIINTNHFYDGLLMQLQRMDQDGFIKGTLDGLVKIVESPEEAISYLDSVFSSV